MADKEYVSEQHVDMENVLLQEMGNFSLKNLFSIDAAQCGKEE